MVEELKPKRTPERGRRRLAADGRGALRWLPVLIFLGMILFILMQEVPAVRLYADRFINPGGHAAVTACRDAVIERAERRDTARIIEPGHTSKTQSGYYVEGIVLGEMGGEGREVRRQFGCYTDGDGNVISAEPVTPAEKT